MLPPAALVRVLAFAGAVVLVRFDCAVRDRVVAVRFLAFFRVAEDAAFRVVRFLAVAVALERLRVLFFATRAFGFAGRFDFVLALAFCFATDSSLPTSEDSP